MSAAEVAEGASSDSVAGLVKGGGAGVVAEKGGGVMVSGSSSSSSSKSEINQNTVVAAAPSRYESQKRRDWHTFGQYLKNHRPPLALSKCSGAHVLEFLRYLDQFGKTKVHVPGCPFFGQPHPPAPCSCPLRQAWGSLDALIGRLRAAYEEHGGKPEANPFGTRAVRLYLRDVREHQAKARGIAYEKKKRRRPSLQQQQQQQQHQQQQQPQEMPLVNHIHQQQQLQQQLQQFQQQHNHHNNSNLQVHHHHHHDYNHNTHNHHHHLSSSSSSSSQAAFSLPVPHFMSNDPTSIMLMPHHT
eukprot:TRINITY_DN23013_c0_g1_i1.p1 TRINITY_DN23013_c0_g1~~TRINITY_DN23013_c0_g1_i1.p1  ORF type:complete len:299 (+),score=46.66 TRINITY_DN23013_c0_g1_i1:652-1548(+)